MTHRRIGQFIVAMAAGLASVTTLTAFQALTTRQLEAALQAGIRLQTVNGDCKGAIEQYAKVAEGNDRALAAQALLRTAGCYEKLGNAQAAAEARSRMVALQASRANAPADPQVRGDRTVWAGHDADGFGSISPDGRFLTYTDWDNGAALALRDLTLSVNYRLTTGGSTEFSVISRDGRQVAYSWVPETTVPRQPPELRIGTLTPTGMSDSRPIYASAEASLTPFDWSPDGTWIAVSAGRAGGTRQIALVRVGDGTLRVLKSVAWKEPTKIFFSPDGKYVAYDLQADDEGLDRHVFVLAVDGTFETPVVTYAGQNTILGWSPDGQSVLFSSEHSGSVGLWGVRVADGKATGEPTLLKENIASAWSLGLTRSGAMYVWKYASPLYVQASAIDLATGRLSPPPSFQKFINSRGRPAWSVDGKYLAFESCNPLGSGPCTLWVQSMDTGRLRQVPAKLGYLGFLSWSPDGRQLITRGRTARGRQAGPVRIDIETGAVTPITPTQPSNGVQWRADSQHVYYRRGAALLEQDLASGAEREIVRIPTAGAGASVVSPDGRTVAYLVQGQSGTQQVFTLPVSGGSPRAVFEVSAPFSVSPRLKWTADGRSLAVLKEHEDRPLSELWLVDVQNGRSRKLDVSLTRWMVDDGYDIDAAGRLIAFVGSAGQPGLEIRALENFLPAARK